MSKNVTERLSEAVVTLGEIMSEGGTIHSVPDDLEGRAWCVLAEIEDLNMQWLKANVQNADPT